MVSIASGRSKLAEFIDSQFTLESVESIYFGPQTDLSIPIEAIEAHYVPLSLFHSADSRGMS